MCGAGTHFITELVLGGKVIFTKWVKAEAIESAASDQTTASAEGGVNTVTVDVKMKVSMDMSNSNSSQRSSDHRATRRPPLPVPLHSVHRVHHPHAAALRAAGPRRVARRSP